ncbi:hypothetical protein KAR91_20150 [Candidatus Pacearchaeota archaeon]|nr:hypothetical protein [Candidatus Pacearchaeota archaeon]
MTFAADIVNDLGNVMDGQETITLTTRRTDTAGDAVDTPYTLEKAVRRQVSHQEMILFNIPGAATSAAWLIQKNELTDQADVMPRHGDTITDAKDGRTWGVKGVEEKVFNSVYRCICELATL